MHAAAQQANTSVRVVGPACTNEYYCWNRDLLGMFLKGAGNRYGSGQVDAVSAHYYAGSSWADSMSIPQAWASRMWSYIQGAIAANDTRPLPVYITEWNLGTLDNGTGFNPMLGHGLVVADMLGAFAQSGVAQEDYFDVHASNSYGTGESRPVDSPTPSYYATAQWDHMGSSLLSLTQSADPRVGVSAYATSKADGSLQVLAINKQSVPQTVNIGFDGASAVGHHLHAYTLSGADGTVGTVLTSLRRRRRPSRRFEVWRPDGNGGWSKICQPTPIANLSAAAPLVVAQSCAVPVNAVAGTYYLKVSVFGPNWSPTYTYNNGAASFVVGGAPATATSTPVVGATSTRVPTNTPIPPTNTSVPPTATPVPPTASPAPPTPTNTPIPPTATSVPATATSRNTPTPPPATATGTGVLPAPTVTPTATHPHPSLPLRVRVSPTTVASGGLIVVRVHTALGAAVTADLDDGPSTHHVLMASGRADRHGNLTLSIRVDDVLAPTVATLMVTATDGLVTATRTTHVIIRPLATSHTSTHGGGRH